MQSGEGNLLFRKTIFEIYSRFLSFNQFLIFLQKNSNNYLFIIINKSDFNSLPNSNVVKFILNCNENNKNQNIKNKNQ